jgi:hypothetical protein
MHEDPDCPIIRLLRRIVEGRLLEDVLIRLVASKRSLRCQFATKTGSSALLMMCL